MIAAAPETPSRLCEDCDEELPAGVRRRRCGHCGKLVCGWCDHHVHAMARFKAKQEAEAGSVTP